MGRSPSHQFGQIIGTVLEECFRSYLGPRLQDLADKYGLYLDRQGKRTARPGSKVSWVDQYGNKHDLDFVLEHGGTDSKVGVPVAFIETAWRRYTKHSRNKAQEIQGAILPLAANNWKYGPFLGVVLAGDFSHDSIVQLESLGFVVLYFRYDSVIQAFKHVGIDAYYDEKTPDVEFDKKIEKWKELTDAQKASVATKLGEYNKSEVDKFLTKLEQSLGRQISSINVLPLHGKAVNLPSIDDAVSFVQDYSEAEGSTRMPVVKYEIRLDFNNGTRIEGQFSTKEEVIDFLNIYQTPLRPAL